MDFSPLVGPAVTAVITGGGVYAMIITRLTRLETLIEALTEEVHKHNGVVERTFKLESDMGNVFHQLDEIKAEVRGLRHDDH